MRYYLASKALRGFSATPATRYAYRKLGNLKRDYLQRNSAIPFKYFERTRSFVEALDRHGMAKPGLAALEIGTGWVHWESLMLRNRTEARVLLYDVWDNRSFRKLQAYAGQLADPAVRARLGLEGGAGAALMERVSRCRSFAEAYALLGFEYLLDPSGTLEGVPEGSFDLVVSSDVGEHIPRESLPLVVERSFRALRPGGWAYHQIVITDHLTIYDRSVHPKEYLRYTREHYQSKILSQVQYINMVQVPEWEDLFRGSGFDIMETNRVGMSDLSAIEVHPSWGFVPEDDLACTVVQFVLRRP
jgi:hypothetical protein